MFSAPSWRTRLLAPLVVLGSSLALAAPAQAGGDRPNAEIVETTGRPGQTVSLLPYLRAPFGSWGQSPAVAARLGMQPLGWRLAVEDWEPPGTDELVRRLLEGVTPGAVVLLHDGGGDRSQTVEAVARIVPELRADGWRFTRPARRG